MDLFNQEKYKDIIDSLYSKPLISTRTGPLYNAFSYPTKISPEAIAVFIATHTEPGATVLDAFGGSGTTGLAALLCARPTENMRVMANDLGIKPKWGLRNAHIFEIGTLGSFVSRILCSPPDPDRFAEAAGELFKRARIKIGWLYEAKDPAGASGSIRHIIWSDVLICPKCANEISYWDATVRYNPFSMSKFFECPSCKHECRVDSCERSVETVEDDFGGSIRRKKRLPARVYGSTGRKNWARAPSLDDLVLIDQIKSTPLPNSAPDKGIVWGDLHRSGYHKGIEKLHHFYSRRNFLVVATLWDMVSDFDVDIQDALRLLLLSYNASHSTLMTRVVVKKGQNDFVLTGAQSGVLYVSGLPVEKNIIEGIVRKSKSLIEAFRLIHGSDSKVFVHQQSSERMDLPDGCIDYVFTDPPFGGNIPYAEINQINELWLDSTTDRSDEIIISLSQGKGVGVYGKMMENVFKEISRVLKPDGLATVVFHSAHSEVWRALIAAYTEALLSVRATSVLDKIQASFKQIVSEVSVKGDPLLLFSKGGVESLNIRDSISIANEIVSKSVDLCPEERDPQRLYSRFVIRCLELGINISMNAKEFYGKTRETFGASV